MINSLLDLLVVDDDDVTIESVERSLRKTPHIFRAVAAEDGLEALQILRGESPKRIGRPYIILLDLNMPRMNGFEFLDVLRADVTIRDAVVFVLSTSDADSDLLRAYHKLIAGYLVKSNVGPQLSKLAHLLCKYAEAVNLPN
jgi:CheY-like chemotaxis protein